MMCCMQIEVLRVITRFFDKFETVGKIIDEYLTIEFLI